MNRFSTAALTDTLYGSFDAIFTQWKQKPDVESHLWELTQDKTTLEILEKDVIDLGTFFSTADSIGTRSEIYLIAEYLAHLRANYQPMTVPRKAEDLVDEIGQRLVLDSDWRSEQHDPLFTPLSYRLGQYALTCGIIPEATLEAYRNALIDFAHHFVLRDGNLTEAEDECMKRFHATLS